MKEEWIKHETEHTHTNKQMKFIYLGIYDRSTEDSVFTVQITIH